jgi:mannose-6-phosphate isomerase-like protein (cupin superfamily)
MEAMTAERREIMHRGPFGDTLRWIAGEDATGGAWSLHERHAPPGARSSPHVHHRLTEAFYLLEGRAEFVVDGESLAGGPGTFAVARPAATHAWTVAGEAPARMLVLFSPSAELAFFEDLHALVEASPDGAPDPRAYMALAEKFGWT